jgi:ribosomal-protein-alanine N-acetyltransferase
MLITFVAPTPNCFPYPDTDIVQIRRATSADIPQIRKLEEQAATAAHWTQAQYESLFSPQPPARVVLVATNHPTESPVLGFVVARCLPEQWEIENIVVDVAARHRGVASALTRALLSQARAAGATSMILEVRESNQPALQLYENIGFSLEGRRKAYYHRPTEDALLFRLPLQSRNKFS